MIMTCIAIEKPIVYGFRRGWGGTKWDRDMEEEEEEEESNEEETQNEPEKAVNPQRNAPAARQRGYDFSDCF